MSTGTDWRNHPDVLTQLHENPPNPTDRFKIAYLDFAGLLENVGVCVEGFVIFATLTSGCLLQVYGGKIQKYF